MKTMKALVKYEKGYGKMELREVPIPKTEPGFIRAKVLACGICGTDIHIMKNEYKETPPLILGHEWVGYIDEVGEGVTGFEKGDKVVSLTAFSTCGHCRYCRDGFYMLCSERRSIGTHKNGAMAEYMVFPASRTYKVPDSIKYNEELALCETLACSARNVIELSPLRAGDIAYISGPGPIGLLALQCAKIQGAFVIMSGMPKDKERLELAKKFGADVVIDDPSKVLDTIHQYSPYGADVVYEAAGAYASVKTCLHAMRPHGTYSQIGVLPGPAEIDLFEFMGKEGTMITNAAQMPSTWDLILRLLAQGRFDLTPLVSSYPLEKWEEAFARVEVGEGYKTLLLP